MATSLRRSAALLTVKFVVLAPICLVVWLLFLPGYARFVGYVASVVLRCMGFTVSGMSIEAGGFLNTDTSLTYKLLQSSMTLSSIGHLVANMAPFVALVLATPGLGLRRMLRVIGIGAILISASHVATIVVRFASRGPIEMGRTPLPTAVGFMSIMLPFLLWIVLAYWGQLMAVLGDGAPRAGAATTAAKPEQAGEKTQ